jgi:hypothetical protein
VIDARAEIQRDMLALRNLGQSRRELLALGDDRSGAFALLTGAAFSLWRAAFLSDIGQGWQEIIDGSTRLLQKVLETNSVPFTTERDVRDWMFGYYLNSALHRLAEVRDMRDMAESGSYETFDEIRRDDLFGIRKPPAELWQVLHETLRTFLRSLEKRLDPPA